MSDSKQAKYIRPEELTPSLAKSVLASLNMARSSEELAADIEVSGERDVGQKVAQNILIRRTQLGGFKDLSQVFAVPQVGPERFTEIVNALSGRKESQATYTIEGQLKGMTALNFRPRRTVLISPTWNSTSGLSFFACSIICGDMSTAVKLKSAFR